MNHSEVEVEVWKSVTGYDGLYEVSNIGRVKYLDKVKLSQHGSFYLRKAGIKASHITKLGYVRTSLTNMDGVSQGRSVHRLVAHEFIDNPNDFPEVNHIDGNKRNNYFKNLEWCTSSHNKKHACQSGLNLGKTGHTGSRNSLSKKIAQFDTSGKLITIWDGLREAERAGFNSTGIWKVASKKGKTHKGYVWAYAD